VAVVIFMLLRGLRRTGNKTMAYKAIFLSFLYYVVHT